MTPDEIDPILENLWSNAYRLWIDEGCPSGMGPLSDYLEENGDTEAANDIREDFLLFVGVRGFLNRKRMTHHQIDEVLGQWTQAVLKDIDCNQLFQALSRANS